ncbi:MAG: ATP-binding cassette domain-containing protein [Anaerolineae bacterium]|nr:ATP-binding cassette domain-containing protein [Anaerolineae bacterium]
MKTVFFKDYSFRYLHQNEDERALNKLNLEIAEGSVVGVIGKAGAGKSTFVKSLNGLCPQVDIGYQDGDLFIDGANVRDREVYEMANKVGIVLQNPELQIFSLTVYDDIAFGPSNLGVKREEIIRRVENVVDAIELRPLIHRSPNNLSGGEQQLLAIAGILAMEPKILAFDEPVSMLDPIGKEQVLKAMFGVTEKNNTLSIITESGADIEAVAEFVDYIVVLDEGKIIASGPAEEVLKNDIVSEVGVGQPQVTELFNKLGKDGIKLDKTPITLNGAVNVLKKELKDKGINSVKRITARGAHKKREFGETIIEVKNLHHYYKNGTHALKGVSLDIPKGQMVGIIGQNGSGKSTLAKHLVGLLKPTNKDAVLKLGDLDCMNPKTKLSDIIKISNYIFQNPDEQLFAETVREEIRFAPRMLEMSKKQMDQEVQEAMDVFDLYPYRKRFIYGLDEDIKTYLAIACVLPMHPEILLIDEPTTGLDTFGEIKMMESLHRLNDEFGKTIVIITHNMKTVANHCDRAIVLSKGEIILDGAPRDVFTQNEELLKADIYPPQITRLGQELAREMDFPRDILTVDEMAATLKSVLKS